jgi:hypothetical protein
MPENFNHWLPFRKQGPGPAGDAVTGRIRREVILPLEALLARVTEPGSEIPAELKESLESVFATVSESFAATDSAGNVETLDQAWQGWELKLQSFAREGGEIGMQRLGKPPPIGGEPVRQLFLAVREAIGNAMRHAAARRIEVLLVPWKDGCAVTVADNGRGMPASKKGGIGLMTMRRRMARCGGELLVHPAEGTVVEFRLPTPAFDCWTWLRDSGRLAHGVDDAHAAALVRRWQERVDACGGFEKIFAGWPANQPAETSCMSGGVVVPKEPGEVPEWLKRRIAAMGLRPELDSRRMEDRVHCRIGWDGAVDPLHWLDLGLDLSRGMAVMLSAAGPEALEIVVARHGVLLPEPLPGENFAQRVHAAWSGGISDLRGDLSSYLHDVLAQEIVAESMHWEIAREACPPSALRSRFDQFQHELRAIAMKARSLSHELDES